MKKILLLGVFLLCVTFIQATEVPFQKAEIKSIMRKADGIAGSRINGFTMLMTSLCHSPFWIYTASTKTKQ